MDAIEGGIFRKVETDWKMSYLARSPGQTTGRITWHLETADPKVTIRSFKISATCATFHGANVRWKVTGSHFKDKEKEEVVLPFENCENFETHKLSGATKVKVTAELAGGMDEDAWQHAQIFRQSLNKPEEASMVLTIITSDDSA